MWVKTERKGGKKGRKREKERERLSGIEIDTGKDKSFKDKENSFSISCIT